MADNNRIKSFKKTIDSEDNRRKREEVSINIRRAKREENLQKRRNINNSSEEASSLIGGEYDRSSGKKPLLENLFDYVNAIKSADSSANLNGTIAVRKLLSVDKNPPAKEIIDTGIMEYLVQFIQCVDNSQLQFEAAWALTNIASTAYTKLVVDAGVVPIMSQLMRSHNADVREQCIWCLGNIAGDNVTFRDIILQQPDCLDALLLNIMEPASEALLRNSVWTLSNFCRGKPPVNFARLVGALPVLKHCIQNNDVEVVADALWAISYLSDGSDDRIQGVIDSNMCPLIINLLKHKNNTIVTPALRIIGNIVSGNEDQTQGVIELGVVPCIADLLGNEKKNIRKEANWALSNIAAGNSQQVSHVLSYKQVPHLLVQTLKNDVWDVKKEACWAVTNCFTCGKWSDIRKLCEAGAVAAVVTVLHVDDTKMVEVALDAIENMLKQAEDVEADFAYVKDLLEECEGYDALEALQYHAVTNIYNKAVNILQQYLEGQDDEDENAPATNATSNMFEFGAAASTPTRNNMVKGFTLTPNKTGKFESPAFN